MLYLVIITAKLKNQTNKKIKSNKNKTKNKTPKNNNNKKKPCYYFMNSINNTHNIISIYRKIDTISIRPN
jgi:hypothetical protein